MSETAKVELLNIAIDNLTVDELLSRLESGVVVTPNIDHLIKLQQDKAFYDCYQAADYVTCDSRLLYLLSHLSIRNPGFKEQIAGSDFLPTFCKYHSERNTGMKVFLLGGTEESVIVAKDNINRRSGAEIVIAGYSPPFGFEHDPAECQKICELITASGATALAVGVGAPKQEKWISRYRQSMPGVKIFLAIGATIEFESGNLSRAPRWMTAAGLEWLYRLLQEPSRLAKRYLIEDTRFFWLFAKQKLGLYKNPWA